MDRLSLLLVVTTLLPLAGAGVIAVTARAGREFSRLAALAVALATLAVSGYLVLRTIATPGGSIGQALMWLGSNEAGLDVRLHLGLDGLSAWLFGLSALLTVTAVLVSWEAIDDQAAAFYALLLALESGMLGVFSARDIILFYLFFEFTLIPLFFLIGIWGSEERRYAAVKFFLFTFAGSVLTFLGLLAIVLWDSQHAGAGQLRFSIDDLTASLAVHPLDSSWQFWIFAALFVGFAIKVPLFPLHTWLPLAHVQAPTAGSVILAGVLLKIGTYGFLRFSLPMLPAATLTFMPWILGLATAGILYGALVALAQRDIKRLIAYSSVSHMGYCVLGLFALNRLGLSGGVLQMINHGLSTGALFAMVGMLYERYHTRQIADLGGLARRTPWLAAMFVLFTMSSIGLPGLNGFAGEFLILSGMFQRAWTESPASLQWLYQFFTVLAVFGVVLGAWYMLSLVRQILFGPLREPHTDGLIADLNVREFAALAPLAVLVFWIGLVPQTFLRPIEPAIAPLARVLLSAPTAAVPPRPTVAALSRDASRPVEKGL